MPEERLQKVLARAGIGSRRKAELFITAGRVKVNGAVVCELGVKVDPDADRITVDDADVVGETKEYWAVHKPVGVITTLNDPWGRPKARDLVPTTARVYPVGRLDADSSGLLLFTNDGALAFQLTHPRFEHQKEYRVRIDRKPEAGIIRRLRRGVPVDGRKTSAAEVDLLERADKGWWLRVILREGRKRQIRRMLGGVGLPVRELIRVRVGPVELGDLPAGSARELTPEERRRLLALVKAE
jgi:23S rRNA pseudouridine2605 synthase